jgi:serine/threonine protein kinase
MKLNSKFLVRYKEVFKIGENTYIIMPYYSKADLSMLIKSYEINKIFFSHKVNLFIIYYLLLFH